MSFNVQRRKKLEGRPVRKGLFLIKNFVQDWNLISMKSGKIISKVPWAVSLCSIANRPYKMCVSGFGGLEVACWPLVPKLAGSLPAETVRFLGRKKSSTHLPSVPCRSSTACKRFLNVTRKSAFRQNSRTFLAQSSTFRRWVLSRDDTRGDAWWQRWERLTQIAQ